MYKQDKLELYQEMLPTIKQLSAIYKVNGLDRDDLEQEFAIVLFKCNDNFDTTKGASFKTFFAASCKNKVKDFWRQNKEMLFILNDPISDPDGGEIIDTIASPYPLIADLYYIDMLRDITNGLITQRWAMGETFQEIADSMNLTVSTVYRMHLSVIDKLREKLDLTEK